MSVRLLAFDTSTEQMALAVSTPQADHLQLAEGGAAASATLLPLLHGLMGQAGLALTQVQAVAFGHGPGAFTGLRTSSAVAQGLGFGLGCPLLPLDSLLIVAEDARWQHAATAATAATCEVLVLMDARMDEVYAGRYRWVDGRWTTLSAPALYALPALPGLWTAGRGGGEVGGGVPALVAGSALKALGPKLGLPTTWPAGGPVLAIAAEQDRPAALLRLALAAWAAGAGVDPALALPLYVRDKVAQTTAEREATKLAKAAQAAALPRA